jgi:acetyltransferase-like isoleucine patch superfamily enzyme
VSRRTFAESLGAALQAGRMAASVLWRLEARVKGVVFEGEAYFSGRPIISVAGDSELRIGAGVRIASSERANPLACFQPSVLRTLAPGARLVLAQNVGLSAAVLCAGAEIVIGEGTIIGAGAMLLDNDFHAPGPGWEWIDDVQTRARPIRVGRGVFIGARAIILKGVTIGDRAVIGAGAVITRDVAPGARAVGNPAIDPPSGERHGTSA